MPKILPSASKVGFQLSIRLLYACPTGRMLRSRSHSPSEFTRPLFSRSAGIPIHLVLQAVPGEADDRHAVLLQPVNVRPLLLQPLGIALFEENWSRCASPAACNGRNTDA